MPTVKNSPEAADMPELIINLAQHPACNGNYLSARRPFLSLLSKTVIANSIAPDFHPPGSTLNADACQASSI
jgi:hypothetical protein